jgi:hypothetical protein
MLPWLLARKMAFAALSLWTEVTLFMGCLLVVMRVNCWLQELA